MKYGMTYLPVETTAIFSNPWMTPLLDWVYLQENPLVELQMDVSNKQQVLDNLKNNEVDFALISIIPDNINLKKIDLIDNKLYMIGKGKVQKSKKALR